MVGVCITHNWALYSSLLCHISNRLRSVIWTISRAGGGRPNGILVLIDSTSGTGFSPECARACASLSPLLSSLLRPPPVPTPSLPSASHFSALAAARAEAEAAKKALQEERDAAKEKERKCVHPFTIVPLLL